MKNPTTLPLAALLTALPCSAQLAGRTAPEGTPTPEPTGDMVAMQWGDYDGDGLEDALSIDSSGAVSLLRSAGGGALEDVTASTGLDTIQDARFALWGDFDADGQTDLFLGTHRGPAHLLQNQGGVFVDVTEGSGLVTPGAHLSAHWVDYDGDRQLDLHLIAEGENVLYHALGQGLFEPIVLAAPAPMPTITAGKRLTENVRTAGPVAAGSAVSITMDQGSSSLPSPVAVGPGGANPTIVPSGKSVSALGSLSCASSLLDASGGGCIAVSTVPTLGMLYPLSDRLFVDGVTGNVGIGTTAPQYALEVAGQLISGTNNVASGPASTIGGGIDNTVNGDENTISGGNGNLITANSGVSHLNRGNTIGGGQSNEAGYAFATISGGSGNVAGPWSAIGGGALNVVNDDHSYASISGGYGNTADYHGAIGGGLLNAVGWIATVGGGEQNEATADYGTIGGGRSNSATGINSTVAGGADNSATADNSTVGGGSNNTASGTGSFAAGNSASAQHAGSFVWGDSTLGTKASSTDDEFNVFAEGGLRMFAEGHTEASWVVDSTGNVGLGTNSPDAALTVSGSSAGAQITVDSPAENYINLRTASATEALVGLSLDDFDGGLYYSTESNQLGFRTNGNLERMTIDAAGRVGIGTTTPGVALDVPLGRARLGGSGPAPTSGSGIEFTSAPTFGSMFAFDRDASTNLDLVLQRDGGNVGIGTTTPEVLLDVAGRGRIGGAGSAPTSGEGIEFLVTGGRGQVFAMDRDTGTPMPLSLQEPGGNVGIGTASPDAPVHIRSGASGHSQLSTLTTLLLESSGEHYLSFKTPASSQAGILFSNPANIADGALRYNEDRAMTLRTANNERVRIDSSGNVGIGTTTPSEKLEVNGNARFTGDSSSSPAVRVVQADTSWYGSRGIRVDATENAGIELSTSATNWRLVNTSGQLNFWSSANDENCLIIYPDNRVHVRHALEVFGGADISGGAVISGGADISGDVDVSGEASVQVLVVTGGADLVEGFDSSSGEALEPGTVVAIDPESPGALEESQTAYDSKVAGVVSGAGGVLPGLYLGQDGVLDGDTKVAMTGRVYVKCSAENGAIRPGDRLTTASLAGHAMKATDTERSVGSVIGKAMTPLADGTGLVLVLVNLQ